MARLQLRLLGGFDLQAGPGQAVPIRLKKAQALLAYLACHPGQSRPRDKLATLLWPEMDDWQARANLRKVLFVLRRGLSVISPSLRLDEDTVTLDTAALDVDVLAFQRLAPQGRSRSPPAGGRPVSRGPAGGPGGHRGAVRGVVGRGAGAAA